MQYKMTNERYQPYGVAVFADMEAVESELDAQNVTDPDARQAYIDALEEIDDSTQYMHKETGSVDTREGWIESYGAEELEERGLTAEEAFEEDEGDTLIELDTTHERVIFDNGGGVTVQLLDWAHYYQDAKQAARDVAAWLKSHNTSDWEGHEPEALACDPTLGEIRNGGYRVWTVGDNPVDEGWGNADDFFAELARLAK